jgi:predicted transcriptional regulator of viral defense system
VKVDEWIEFFKKYKEKKLFSFTDILQLTEEDKSKVYVELSRLVKSGIIDRIAKNWYENPFSPPSKEEIAMILRYPSYLSMEYALSKQDILSQTVYTLTLVTTKLPYIYKTNRAIYEYHQIKRNLFWGYKKEGNVLLAEPEKALLDLIYIRYAKRRGSNINMAKSMLDDMDLEEIDFEKLHIYSKNFPPKTRKILMDLKIN